MAQVQLGEKTREHPAEALEKRLGIEHLSNLGSGFGPHEMVTPSGHQKALASAARLGALKPDAHGGRAGHFDGRHATEYIATIGDFEPPAADAESSAS